MINDVKQLWFKIIFFNGNYNGPKFLIPNKFGEGVFYWDHDKQEVVNGSNRPGLIIGVSSSFSFYLPIQSDYSNSENGYDSGYADGLFEMLYLENLCENSLKNNSVLHYDNIIKIDNRLLMTAIKRKNILYKNIFVNDLRDDKSLFPLKIIWELYRIANSEFWENNVTIQTIINENFYKNEIIETINDKEFKYINIATINASSVNQVDIVFEKMNVTNRSILNNSDFYKNNINENLDNIKNQYLGHKNYICELFCKTIDEKYLKHIVDKDEWLKNIDSDEMFNGIWESYEYEKNKNNRQKIFVMEKNIVDQFGNNINYTKENNANKNINSENKKQKGFER